MTKTPLVRARSQDKTRSYEQRHIDNQNAKKVEKAEEAERQARRARGEPTLEGEKIYITSQGEAIYIAPGQMDGIYTAPRARPASASKSPAEVAREQQLAAVEKMEKNAVTDEEKRNAAKYRELMGF